MTDGPRFVRAMDPIYAFADVEGAGAKRVVEPPRHVIRNDPAIGFLAHDHLGRRRPSGPLGLPRDRVGPGPLEALAADADPVFDRLPLLVNVVEPAFIGVDDDRIRAVGSIVVDE